MASTAPTPELVYRIHKDSVFGNVIRYIVQANSTSSSSFSSSTFSWSTWESRIEYKDIYYDMGYNELRMLKMYMEQHYDSIINFLRSSSSITIPSSLSSSVILTWLLQQHSVPTVASPVVPDTKKNSNDDTDLSSSTVPRNSLRIGIIGQPSNEELLVQAKEKQTKKEIWRQQQRSRAAHYEYLSLVQDIRKEEIEASKPNEIVEYKAQMSLGISLLVVLFSAAILGYILGRAWYGSQSSMPYIIAALFGGFMLMIEGCLTVTRLSKIDYIQNQKRKNTTNQINPNMPTTGIVKVTDTLPMENTSSSIQDQLDQQPSFSSSSNAASVKFRGTNSGTSSSGSLMTTSTTTNNANHSRSSEQFRNLQQLTQSLKIQDKKTN